MALRMDSYYPGYLDQLLILSSVHSRKTIVEKLSRLRLTTSNYRKDTTMPEADDCDHKINAIREDLRSDISEIKDALKELAQGMSKLALVEERQSRYNEDVKAMSTKVETIGNRVSALEIAQANNSRISAWFDKGILTMLGALAVYIGHKVGLI
jgi:hypothetical protein